uniref:Uncharacterized protein n=1 Tax=Rhizophora mucronata TaxID=61149 RepID=A0A2P2MYE1_RHIMU
MVACILKSISSQLASACQVMFPPIHLHMAILVGLVLLVLVALDAHKEKDICT